MGHVKWTQVSTQKSSQCPKQEHLEKQNNNTMELQSKGQNNTHINK